MSMSFRERFFSFLINFASVLEPIAARFISYYVRRELKKLKERGLILDYKTRTRRIGKFHYKTHIELILNLGQSQYIFSKFTAKAYRVLGR